MILVTGGTGFVGSHLLRSLVQNAELNSATLAGPIRAIRRKKSNMGLVADVVDKIEWIDTDVLDPIGLADAMRGVRQLYHSAAMISFVDADRDKMIKINAGGTANVVNAALEAGVEKLVHVSSIAALGRSALNDRVDEKTAWEDSPFNTNYGLSKMLAERELWRGVAEGLSAVAVNPSIVLGRGDWGQSSGRLFSRIWNGLRFCPKGGTGFVDVLDVVKAMIGLMNSPTASGERYVLSAENLSYRDFFDLLAKHLHKKAPQWEASPWLAAIARPFDALRSKITGSPPLITRETMAMSSRRFYYDNAKIKTALPGFAFNPIEETVKRVCAEFKADLRQ